MRRTLLLALALATLAATGAVAQEPAPTQKPEAAEPSQPRQGPQPVNVRIDLALSEEGEGAAPPKTVTMLVAAGELGRIRTGAGSLVLNVDARPVILQNGLIRVMLSLQYGTGSPSGHVSQSLYTVLTSGKPLMVSQSADPKSDRRVTAELTATVLK